VGSNGAFATAQRSIFSDSPARCVCRFVTSLARAYALQGDTAKARTGYQDFLMLWKEADRDIPIFLEAKTQYAKLK
jgi:eukaryotic-like serine/threonine-protein kinase